MCARQRIGEFSLVRRFRDGIDYLDLKKRVGLVGTLELLWMATVKNWASHTSVRKIGEDDKGVAKRDALRGLITR